MSKNDVTTKDARIAVITGASSGIGQATASALLRVGYRVFGTSRTAGATSADGVTMLVCDVTDDASVQAMVDEVVQQTGRVDLLVNNAGMGLLGGAEESSTAQAQALFNLNVFGVIRVTNAVLPIMRGQKEGRIVNISSILGLIPAPYNALYSATKHAVEGYSESLDHELRNFGIRVVLVEPGVTHTSFEKNLNRADTPLAIYDSVRHSQEDLTKKWVETGDAPEVVANIVAKAATTDNVKHRYTAGKQSSQARLLRRFAPERMFDRILRKAINLPV